MQTAIRAIAELATEAAKPSWDWQPAPRDESMIAALKGAIGNKLEEAFQVRDKLQRRDAIAAIKTDVLASMQAEAEQKGWHAADIGKEFAELEYRTLRDSVLKTKIRIDGRKLDDVRPISARVGVLPRAHGSALFTRGETQALVAVTLGTTRDAQIIDAPEGESKDPFLFHYNFPPFSVGEAGRFGAPKRREIGHGRLAKRGVHGGQAEHRSLPVRAPRRLRDHRVQRLLVDGLGVRFLAGDDGRRRADQGAGGRHRHGPGQGRRRLRRAQSDILGDEDHLGDMDFKVAGTADGITALQMDIKIDGITEEIMKVALAQAKRGRLHILGEMDKVAGDSRAPR